MPSADYFQRQKLLERTPPEERLHSYQFWGGDWRWQRAKDVSTGEFPPDAALDCPGVQRAAAFLRRWKRGRGSRKELRQQFSDVYAAWQLNRAPLLRLLSVQARLLSLQTASEIASKTGIDPAVIAAYSELFYSFAHAYLDGDAWIRGKLIKTDFLPGLCTSLRSIVLHLAFYGGVPVAEDILDTLSRLKAPIKIGKLVRGDAPFSEHDWRVIKALSVHLVPLSQTNAIQMMRENVRIRAARRPEVSDEVVPSSLMAMEWRDEMQLGRLMKPYLETELATLKRSAAA